jgi:uncharacterized protein involved in exopolysaccharide biosynthesis
LLQYEDEIDLREYAKTIVKYRNLIYICLVGAFVFSSLFSLTLPKQYKAEALISASSPDSKGSLASMSILRGMGLSLPIEPASANNNQVIAVLKSRSMADFLIGKFDLLKEFNTKKIDAARASIKGLLNVKATKEGMLSVTIEYTDPEKAKDLVNSAVDRLDEMNRGFRIYGASREKQFLESRLSEVKIGLTKAEDALKIFQEQNGLIEMSTQTASTVGAVGSIYSMLFDAETELAVKKQFKSENDPEIKELSYRVSELKRKINTISNKEPGKGTKDYLIPLSKAPQMGLEFLRLKRELKIEEALFELLTEQFEIAKINEAKNTPTITIIDKAVTPEIRSKPQRRLIVMVSTALAFFLSIFLCFIAEAIKLPEKSKLIAKLVK